MSEYSLVSPTIDLVFKKIFGSSAHPKQLLDLVNAVLESFDEPVLKEITVSNPELIPEDLSKKMAILDIKAKGDQDNPINIEMQVIDHHNWEQRILLYWAKLYADQLDRGQNYHELKKTISICILNFKLFDRKRKHCLYELRERLDYALLCDLQQIYFIELPKKDMGEAPPKHLSEWIDFFNVKSRDDFEKLNTQNEAIQEAFSMLNQVSQNPAERELIENRRKALLDYNTDIKGAREQGFEQGIEQGIEQNQIENAIKMKKDGIDIELISKYTGLSIDDLNKLES